MIDKTRINIMTSCDDKLTKYIFVQLRTIAMHLRDKEVHFYLFYNRIPEETLEKLEIYCECLGNIIFHRIFIEDIEPYIEFVNNASGAIRGKESAENKNPRWPYEAYFTFGCQIYLPNDMDRILYIDAGDVIFTGDIDEFYFDDFEGKSIIATMRYKNHNNERFKSEDLNDNQMFRNITTTGLFNSGSYIINVDSLRKKNINMEKYLEKSREIAEKLPKGQKNVTDEALLSVSFIDDIKYFAYEEMQKDIWYQPYNFMLFFYRENTKEKIEQGLWYDPKIVHMVGCRVKPWELMNVIIQEKIMAKGQKTTIDEVLRISTTLKLRELKNTESPKLECTLLEPGMVPFFEYWYEINNLVQIELLEIFG